MSNIFCLSIEKNGELIMRIYVLSKFKCRTHVKYPDKIDFIFDAEIFRQYLMLLPN